MNGTRQRREPLPPLPAPEVLSALLEPPPSLSPEVQLCWRAFAPKALDQRTLIPAEVPGFIELCIRQARVVALDQQIDRLGAGSKEALPYMKERRGWGVLLNASLKDFKLTAFGKPSVSDKPKPAANPFAAFA